MKNYLFIFIYILVGCDSQSEIPDKLQKTTWVQILEEDGKFYRLCDEQDIMYTFKFFNDSLRFFRMSDEYEKIKNVSLVNNEYSLSFEPNSYGNIDYVYKVTWKDENLGITYWEYLEDGVSITEDTKYYSKYQIDSLNYYRLPDPPCLACNSKVHCETLENVTGIYEGINVTTWTQNLRNQGEVDIMVKEQVKLNIVEPDSVVYLSKTIDAKNVSYPNEIIIRGSLIRSEDKVLKIHVETIFYDSELQSDKSFREYEIVVTDNQNIYLQGEILNLEKGGIIRKPSLILKKQ
ncbi:MAG: hypothetical protein N4A45_06940 [Flavobacteriales bacterium]|jgi:hypothetical protein|nr:hypothetical protein [Flavobacteriales bacterium]